MTEWLEEIVGWWVLVVRRTARSRVQESWRAECVRAVSEVMDALGDDQPEWREWFAYQLELLDLEYDRAWWIKMEEIR